jgi:alpha-tubulin suppressor-like RCC1 family protein
MKKRISAIKTGCGKWILWLVWSVLFVANVAGQNTSVVVWGDNTYGELNVPPGLTSVVAIAAGDDFCLALNSNGTVVAWGDNSENQTEVPNGLTNIVAISAGHNFALALDNNGNAYVWGNYWKSSYLPQTFLPYVGLSAGHNNSLALQSDGTVAVSGDVSAGETAIPPTANNIVAIAAGDDCDIALRNDGTVVAWGSASSGQTDIPSGLNNVVAITAEGDDAFALEANGTVARWGADYPGPGGVVPGVSNVVAISGNLALQSGGMVIPLGAAQSPPLTGLANVVAVGGGAMIGMALLETGAPLVAPMINRSVYRGSSVLLTSSAAGAYPLTYQWQLNGRSLLGANRSWLIFTNAQPSASGSYTVTVTNVSGATTGPAGQLTVSTFAPSILAQPLNIQLPPGNTAAFTVTAVGSLPLSYQWRLSGSVIPGATNALLLMPNITNGGQYSVLITNTFGSVLSSNATVTFEPSVIVGLENSDDDTYTYVTNIPPNLTNAVEVANSDIFALAVTASGSIVGWGDDSYGETDVPAGLLNPTQIAVGFDYSFALVNGTVYAWGDDSAGQCDVPHMTNAVQVLSGQYPMALKSDGTVVEWAGGIVPANVSNVIAIAEGGCSLALQSDGQVAAWGNSYFGLTNVPPGLSNVVAIAAGEMGCLALSADGRVTAWGIGAATNFPSGLSNVVAITALPASIDYYAAVTTNGHVFSWGLLGLGYGEELQPQGLATNVPAYITNAAEVFLQPLGALTVNRDSTLSGWGNDGYEATLPPWLTNVVTVAVSPDYSSAMVLEGRVPPRVLPKVNEFAYSGTTVIVEVNATGSSLDYQWQLNGVNIPGANLPWLVVTNVQTPGPPPSPLANYTVIVSNAYGSATNAASLNVVNSPPIIQTQPQSLELPPNNNFTFSVGASGSGPLTYQWQFNGTNIPGANGPSYTVNNAQLPSAGYYSVAVSNPYIVASGPIVSSNAGLSFSITSVAVWGNNSEGQLNVFSNLTDVLAVSAAADYNLALLAGGTVVAWGAAPAPLPSSLTNIIAIAAGDGFSLALGTNGTVISWGSDAWGPITVPAGLSHVAAIAAGGRACMALQSNGLVTVWGDPDETNVPSSVSNVISIAATADDCLALRSNGTVVEWGDNSGGQSNYASTLTNIMAIGSGADSHFNTAVKGDGTVVVWNAVPEMQPPSGLSNVVAVASGNFFCLALLNNRTAVAWGIDSLGDLEIPPGLTNVTQRIRSRHHPGSGWRGNHPGSHPADGRIQCRLSASHAHASRRGRSRRRMGNRRTTLFFQ